jgi:cystathionine beta-lyase/cystathionine gamma-synthase
MIPSEMSIETKLIHAGEPRPRPEGAVVMPIYQSSTYEYTGATDYHDVRYIRLNNSPNQLALNAKVAALENAEAALVAASGMAAISTALLTVLKTGDHVLALDCLYGGTHGFVTKDLPRFGVAHSFIRGNNQDSWRRELRPNTKAVYVETLTNPLLQICDLKGVVEFARAHKLITLIDNTFASPVNFRPAEHGYDITLESCTKYLNGHNDIVAGSAAGRADLILAMKYRLDHLGGTLDPHACYLLQRGLKTLAVRVRHQNQSALRIAQFLSEHRAVAKVNYPGLKTHAQHAKAAELFEGFGGMISFELRGGAESAERFFKRSRLAALAVSLGGVETLVVRPAAAVHSNLSPQERAASGISDGLIRLSVGLESTDDLITDFDQALG